jgi:hypothetical protein
LYIDQYFSHSIALTAFKRRCKSEDLLYIPADSKVAVFGQDWSARLITEELPFKGIRLINHVSQIENEQYVIIGYDYTNGPSYFSSVQKLEKRGYKLGRNLFLFQMLMP